MKRTNKVLLWSAVLAMLLGFGVGCGGMEEDEGGLSSDEIDNVGEVASREQALSACPTGYYQVWPSSCTPSSLCYKCCPFKGTTLCKLPPSCPCSSWTMWNICKCYVPQDNLNPVSCGVYFNFRASCWMWKCCDNYRCWESCWF